MSKAKENISSEERWVRVAGKVGAVAVALGTVVLAFTGSQVATLQMLYLIAAVAVVQLSSVAAHVALDKGSGIGPSLAGLALSVNSTWIALHMWALWARAAEGSGIYWGYEGPILAVCILNAGYFFVIKVRDRKAQKNKKRASKK